jgi:hypothetical protein
MWFAFFLISSGGCGYLVYQSITNYLNFEVVTQIQKFNSIPSPFPTITICNINPIANKYSYEYVNNTLAESNFDIKEGRNGDYKYTRYYLSFLINHPNISEEQRRLFAPPINETVLACSFGGQDCQFEKDFDYFFSSYYGLCYQFNGKRNFKGETLKTKSVSNGKDFIKKAT